MLAGWTVPEAGIPEDPENVRLDALQRRKGTKVLLVVPREAKRVGKPSFKASLEALSARAEVMTI